MNFNKMHGLFLRHFFLIKGSLPFYSQNDPGKSEINLITNKFNLKTANLNFLVDSCCSQILL